MGKPPDPRCGTEAVSVPLVGITTLRPVFNPVNGGELKRARAPVTRPGFRSEGRA